jgi:Flp pilus assembly protein TadD
MTEIPDNGDILWEQAQTLHLQNNFDEAKKIYVKLLEQNHANPGLMATLGSLYVQTEEPGLAIHFLEAAIANGLGLPDVHTNIALAYNKSGQRGKARAYFEKSIEKDPSPEALTNYSAMFIEAGESKKCTDLCRRAIEGNPDLPIAHWNLALSLLSDGVWGEAWDEHEWGLKVPSLREDRIVLEVPMWEGPVKQPDCTVLVWGEQGIGDEIMFASMLREVLKTNKVVLECFGRLETLFKKSFPEIDVYGTREDREVNWVGNHKIDYRIPIGSLGKFYRRSAESFPGTPYLVADAAPKGDKFRVGIAWSGGGIKLGRVQKRSVPLSWWKSILNVPGIEFISLQHTDATEELDLMDTLGYSIKRMEEVKARDYYETARLVKSCDLVISVCTSVIHLAGALGVPCWVMTPKYPAWRYQNSGKMPWYRSVRLYRSPETDQSGWMPVIQRIGLDLDDLMKVRKAA